MFKIPRSVLVVIHTADQQVLLLERADAPGYWQSVTGSQDEGETLLQTAVREVREETGLDALEFGLSDWRIENRFEIFERWRQRYAPGIRHNVGSALASPATGQAVASGAPGAVLVAVGESGRTVFLLDQCRRHSPAGRGDLSIAPRWSGRLPRSRPRSRQPVLRNPPTH